MVLDVFSRPMVAWALERCLRTELVLSALPRALTRRQPEDVIHHCDHGSQYTAIAFGARCIEAGVKLAPSIIVTTLTMRPTVVWQAKISRPSPSACAKALRKHQIPYLIPRRAGAG